jgi:Holliday junction resolvasome RuvABC DNA-binding subunit
LKLIKAVYSFEYQPGKRTVSVLLFRLVARQDGFHLFNFNRKDRNIFIQLLLIAGHAISLIGPRVNKLSDGNKIPQKANAILIRNLGIIIKHKGIK